MLVVADLNVCGHVDFVWSDASFESRVSFSTFITFEFGLWAIWSHRINFLHCFVKLLGLPVRFSYNWQCPLPWWSPLQTPTRCAFEPFFFVSLDYKTEACLSSNVSPSRVPHLAQYLHRSDDALAQMCQIALTFAMSVGMLEMASEEFRVKKCCMSGNKKPPLFLNAALLWTAHAKDEHYGPILIACTTIQFVFGKTDYHDFRLGFGWDVILLPAFHIIGFAVGFAQWAKDKLPKTGSNPRVHFCKHILSWPFNSSCSHISN